MIDFIRKPPTPGLFGGFHGIRIGGVCEIGFSTFENYFGLGFNINMRAPGIFIMFIDLGFGAISFLFVIGEQ